MLTVYANLHECAWDASAGFRFHWWKKELVQKYGWNRIGVTPAEITVLSHFLSEVINAVMISLSHDFRQFWRSYKIHDTIRIWQWKRWRRNCQDPGCLASFQHYSDEYEIVGAWKRCELGSDTMFLWRVVNICILLVPQMGVTDKRKEKEVLWDKEKRPEEVQFDLDI